MKKLDPLGPTDRLDYYVDWTEWLATDGDSIVSSDWTAEDGITIDEEELSAGITRVWLTGGTINKDYRVENAIVTTAGRTARQTIIVPVRDT